LVRRFFFPVVAACATLVVSAAPAQNPASAVAPSQINVMDARFGAGCPNLADPTGRVDSTCAIRAALRAAEQVDVHGTGYPVLYFPHGRFNIAGEGYTSALTITKAVSIQGAGEGATVIVNTSPHAAALTYLKASDCNAISDSCAIHIQGLTFAGLGKATDGGLIELDSTIDGTMRDVALTNTGGIALNLQGASERWFFTDMEIGYARWPVVLEGDTNEDYFQRVNVLGGGRTHDYCYGVNCPGGKTITNGVWRPDPHSAVFLDGENVHWTDSSIKATDVIGGIRPAIGDSSVTNTYIEGYPYGGQPRTNHAIAAPGPTEIGHITSAVSATALTIPVDDAGWQPLYVNDPSQAQANGRHSYVNMYGIFPVDYVVGSKEPSRSVPGITRGTVEVVTVGAFSGDGNAHLIARGKNAIAWPAGSIMEQFVVSGYGTLEIREDHINSLGPAPPGRYSSGCSDTAQRTDWTSSPSELCAEIIAGAVPDGYMVPFPTQTYVHAGFGLDISDNAIYFGGSEEDGQGWIKIPGDAAVLFGGPGEPLRAFVDAETALHRYVNGNRKLQIVQWPGTQPVSALAYVDDPSAGVRFSPQEGFYSASVMHDRVLDHQYLGSQCWYDTPAGTEPPGHRDCTGPHGMSSEALVGGRWTAAAPAGSQGSTAHAEAQPAVGFPLKYTVRDWNVNVLAPAGHPGDCAGRSVSTGAVRFNTSADATLIVNLSPNPGASTTATAAITGDGTHADLRLCNTGDTPVRWMTPPLVVLTQLP
jgi:hypothetical protein